MTSSLMYNLLCQYLRSRTPAQQGCLRYLLTKCLAPLLIILSLLWFEGCQFPFEFRTQEEIRKEVLDKDPAFSDILDEKAKLDEQIKALKVEFEDKKKLIEKKISSLKEELKSAKEYTDSRIRAIDSQLGPPREELKLKIKKLAAELKLKESSLAATKKAIAKFTKLTQEKGSSENLPKEAPSPQDNISSLKIQAQELERDVSFLRAEIRINRLKLKLLKQAG